MIRAVKIALLVVLFFFLADGVSAQCAMCSASAESSDNEGVVNGINNGIVYLMAIPYLLIFTVVFAIYHKQIIAWGKNKLGSQA